jgi:hypothetical protein
MIAGLSPSWAGTPHIRAPRAGAGIDRLVPRRERKPGDIGPNGASGRA